MKLHYSLDSAIVLDPVHGPTTLSMLKDAGVSSIWLWGYFFGKLWSPVEDMVRAKEVIENNGFEVGIIQLPVGHPGNGLNPEDESLDLQLPSHWRYRKDIHGNPVYYCADIEDTMIEDNRKSIEMLRKVGFTRFFMDDDLRMEQWGSQIGGCYCDVCLTDFNAMFKRSVTREALGMFIANRTDSAVLEDWTQFNCSKVTQFMSAMQQADIQLGIMVMYLGDERHGIDVPAIKLSCKDVMFRVGEYHFSDETFATPTDKAEELLGILYHLNLMGRENAYSETTVFPPRALHAANLLFKAKMAVAAGIPNILFMSGTWLIDQGYWQTISDGLPALQDVESKVAPYERSFPVHIVSGTHGSFGEEIVPSVLPILAGLPAKPVRGREIDAGLESPAELLLFFGNYLLTAAWITKLSLYKRVFFDKTAVECNKETLKFMPLNNVEMITEELSIELLRQKIQCHSVSFPMMTSGENIAVIWLAEARSVIFLNLMDDENKGILTYDGHDMDVSLQGLEMLVISF